MIAAPDLLRMSPETFFNLRRELLQNTSEPEPLQPRLTCAICGVGLHLALHGSGNRYFVHDDKPPVCPWYTGCGVTRDMKEAEDFLTEKESPAHFRLKWLIADALKRDPETNGTVMVQGTLWGQLLTGEWRRPDVQCTWRGRRIAFEIQLGTTHLREIVYRENFYRAEGIYVIWVFHPAAMDRAAHSDERFFNRRNVFFVTAEDDDDLEIDEAEPEDAQPVDRLKLLCRYDKPLVDAFGDIQVQADETLVGLEDLTYPDDHHRPFYFDFPARLAEAQEKAVQVKAAKRAAADHEAAQRRAEGEWRRQAWADAEQKRKSATVTPLAAVSPADFEANAFNAYREQLDHYQKKTYWAEERLQRFQSVLRLFVDPRSVWAAEQALYPPTFQLLLMVRGLERASPFPSSAGDLPRWCNDRLAELDAANLDLVYSLIGYAAWSAYPPSQPRLVQDRLYAKLTRLGQEVAAQAPLSSDNQELLEFVGKLFPRVGDIIQSKMRKP